MAFDLNVQESYADALFAVAERLGRTQPVHESARELADYLETHPDRRLRVFIESPQVPDSEKHDLVRRVFGGKVDKLIVDLMCLMVDKRRSGYVAGALRRYCEKVDERRNVYPGFVATAKALTDEERRRVRERLESFTGSSLRLRFRVDPNLIGGVLFKYRNLLVDSTLREALKGLRERLDGLRLRLAPPEMEESG